ncbi:Cell cycle checkpoint control protein RAD9A [Camponotus floridanus]|uniref:Cell cycle checkpoint control protein RAD9A n=1 Tax=Camponotus floridanus TaxID=104421 RepID=E2AHS4_CAMFO|nr:cell cycle checkpoint control protein RAD9A [Camponotus floridanus]EFN67003.1 Cell cycle checkpoint control protein RAD9A [Camponotus floridanus]
MKCIIPGGNVKTLAKAIHMLAKIGDEMYINPQQEYISFRTVNMAKSAYSDVTFHKNFFSYYTLEDLEEEEAQKCKISMRSAMTVFKSAHTLEKQVENCHICLEVNSCNLIFILKYKNGVNKSHLSPILEPEKLQASYTKAGMINELTSQARTLVDALQNFPQNLIEITLEITQHKLLLRNYVDEASIMVNTTRTQLAFGTGEFDRYIMGNETTITFCLKEVRALLTFSESIGIPININFETAGRPMLLTLKNQGLEVKLLLSTLSPDSDSQSDSSTINKQVQPIRRKSASSRNISKRINKSSNRIKKSTLPSEVVVDNIIKNRSEKKENQMDKMLNQTTSVNIISVEANNSINNAQERSLKQSRLLLNPVSATSSMINKKIPDDQRKLVNSVFSNIAKRKSISDEEDGELQEQTVGQCINLGESVLHSPSPLRQATKKAKLVFQKCFQNTFDPQMLPGYNTILVEDSDENNSD